MVIYNALHDQQHLQRRSDKTQEQWIDEITGGEGLFVIRGVVGATEFMSNFALREPDCRRVISVTCGGDEGPVTVRELLIHIVRQLESLLQKKQPFGEGFVEPHPADDKLPAELEQWYFTMSSRLFRVAPSLDAWRGEFHRLLNEVTQNNVPLVLLVEGIDRLAWELWNERLYWLPKEFPSGMRVVVSCSNSFPLRVEADIFGKVTQYTLPLISDSCCRPPDPAWQRKVAHEQYLALRDSGRPEVICEPTFIRLCFAAGQGKFFQDNIWQYGSRCRRRAAVALRRQMLLNPDIADDLAHLTEKSRFAWTRSAQWQRESGWLLFLTESLFPTLCWDSCEVEHALYRRLSDAMFTALEKSRALQSKIAEGADPEIAVIQRDIAFACYLCQTVFMDEDRWSDIHDRYIEALGIALRLVQQQPDNRAHFCKAKEMLVHTLIAPVVVAANWDCWEAFARCLLVYEESLQENDRFLCAQSYHLLSLAHSNLGQKERSLHYRQRTNQLLESLLSSPKPCYRLALAESLALLATELALQDDERALACITEAERLLEPLAGREKGATHLLAWAYTISAEVWNREAKLADAIDRIQKSHILYFELYEGIPCGYYRECLAQCWHLQAYLAYEQYKSFPIGTYLDKALDAARKAMEWYLDDPPREDDAFLLLLCRLANAADTSIVEDSLVYAFSYEADGFCSATLAGMTEEVVAVYATVAQLYHLIARFFAEGGCTEKATELCRTAIGLLQEHAHLIDKHSLTENLERMQASADRYSHNSASAAEGRSE